MSQNSKSKSNPRPKRPSDELYNLRRRLRRNIASLEKNRDSLTRGQRNNLEYFRVQLENLTPIKGMRSTEDILKSEESNTLRRRLNTALQPRGLQGRQRREFEVESDILKSNLAKSSKKGGEALDVNSLRAVVFMQATRQHWQGLPMEDRFKNIIEGMGVNSLAEVMAEVQRANPEVFAILDSAELNTDSDAFDTRDDERVNYPSKQLMAKINFV